MPCHSLHVEPKDSLCVVSGDASQVVRSLRQASLSTISPAQNEPLKVYSSVTFNTFAMLCNQHYCVVPEHFITPLKKYSH